MYRPNIHDKILYVSISPDEYIELKKVAFAGIADDPLEWNEDQLSDLCAEFVYELIAEVLPPKQVQTVPSEDVPLNVVDRLNLCLEQSVETALDGQICSSDSVDDVEGVDG